MANGGPAPQIYEFGGESGKFRLDAAARVLLRSGAPVPLTPKVFDTLLYLLQGQGKLVSKAELMSVLWPDTTVEENNLNQNISALRRILPQNYIATVPRLGYRFTAAVHSFPSAAPPRTIAVLPFQPLIAGQRDEALELGMADTLIARLGSIRRSLVVRPLSSVRKYNHLEQDALSAGRELNVQSVLHGSIQRSANYIRVIVCLSSASDGTSLWAQTFDEEFKDVFSVQDKISEKVAVALALQLAPAELNRLANRATQNVEAYHAYLKGRYFVSQTVQTGIRKGIEFFQQAIDLDPCYALAYAGLADAYRRLPITSDVPAKDAFPKGKAAALKALEIDGDLAEAHTWLGFIQFWYDWDWSSAERHLQRAIALDPDSGFAHIAYAHLLTNLRRFPEALVHGERAVELDPLSLMINALHGWVLNSAGRVEEALAQFKKTLEIGPNFWVARLHRGKIHLQNQDYDRAITDFANAREHSGGNSETISLIAYTHAVAGDQQQARAILAELLDRSAEHYVPPHSIAMIYAGLGEIDQALYWLERAYTDRDVHLSFLKIEYKWDVLRPQPRFQAIARGMGLE